MLKSLALVLFGFVLCVLTIRRESPLVAGPGPSFDSCVVTKKDYEKLISSLEESRVQVGRLAVKHEALLKSLEVVLKEFEYLRRSIITAEPAYCQSRDDE